uniref:Uncharacterized protein n=1 Tax=Tetraselmis sp. GSL018 TaxID=582737 RepID=A0A061QP59_9CHLO
MRPFLCCGGVEAHPPQTRSRATAVSEEEFHPQGNSPEGATGHTSPRESGEFLLTRGRTSFINDEISRDIRAARDLALQHSQQDQSSQEGETFVGINAAYVPLDPEDPNSFLVPTWSLRCMSNRMSERTPEHIAERKQRFRRNPLEAHKEQSQVIEEQRKLKDKYGSPLSRAKTTMPGPGLNKSLTGPQIGIFRGSVLGIGAAMRRTNRQRCGAPTGNRRSTSGRGAPSRPPSHNPLATTRRRRVH